MPGWRFLASIEIPEPTAPIAASHQDEAKAW
jgi:hypothetical protein